ncbi:MAG: hypothetical protein HUK04_04110 [Bacteroidaceae bacterium]|nr:hypothetical protein [Bacteroidaceae bacterium]MCF0188657.1 hypothetical protein [Bacteroidaceae bacterium]
MREVQFIGRTISVPEVADEMGGKQYEAMLVAQLTRDPAQVRALVAKAAMGLRVVPSLYLTATDADMATADEVAAMFCDESGRVRLSPLRNLIPVHGEWRAKAGDMLNGMTFGDFMTVMGILRQLDGEDGQEAEEMVEALVRAMYDGPKERKPSALLALHCFTFFNSVWTHLTTTPVKVDGEDICYTILFQGGGGGRYGDDHLGWNGIRLEVAKGGVFGTVRDVDGTPLWDVLTWLYKCRKEYNRMKK